MSRPTFVHVLQHLRLNPQPALRSPLCTRVHAHLVMFTRCSFQTGAPPCHNPPTPVPAHPQFGAQHKSVLLFPSHPRSFEPRAPLPPRTDLPSTPPLDAASAKVLSIKSPPPLANAFLYTYPPKPCGEGEETLRVLCAPHGGRERGLPAAESARTLLARPGPRAGNGKSLPRTA